MIESTMEADYTPGETVDVNAKTVSTNGDAVANPLEIFEGFSKISSLDEVCSKAAQLSPLHFQNALRIAIMVLSPNPGQAIGPVVTGRGTYYPEDVRFAVEGLEDKKRIKLLCKAKEVVRPWLIRLDRDSREAAALIPFMPFGLKLGLNRPISLDIGGGVIIGHADVGVVEAGWAFHRATSSSSKSREAYRSITGPILSPFDRFDEIEGEGEVYQAVSEMSPGEALLAALAAGHLISATCRDFSASSKTDEMRDERIHAIAKAKEVVRAWANKLDRTLFETAVSPKWLGDGSLGFSRPLSLQYNIGVILGHGDNNIFQEGLYLNAGKRPLDDRD